MKILLTGGGTGGHIIPLLTIVSEIKKMEEEKNLKKSEYLFIGPKSDFNNSISDIGMKIKIIQAGKLRRYFSFENFTDIFKIVIGTIQSLYFIHKFKPTIVFSKGGFASVPPVVAAWLLKIPILTHESDTIPGLANRIIAKFSKKILVSFYFSKKYFPEKKVILTGNPIREEILQGNKNSARKFFNLNENIPTILVFGGSQGAKKINSVIVKSLPKILEKFQIIHLCGKRNYEELKIKTEKMKLKNNSRYRIYPFLSNELKDAFALYDVIISRAGASSLFEIIALEKPSIIIPLPSSANNHQAENAKFFQDRNMIINIKEKDFKKEIFTEKLFELFEENNLRKNMIEKMHEYNNFIGQKPVYNIIEEIFDFSDLNCNKKKK
ncbi:MAG: undecaprenyldiphospho-muramoylpentapeptide beta-N-acetylglucosaminyltransferase [Candidatus Pacebacteria bacterium]|nr:undecaprenyldiphospho-muramoylpentapeptide beta-N-acetylglucosaminyltransferase [Candidatus Paceibacterota bacterium]